MNKYFGRRRRPLDFRSLVLSGVAILVGLALPLITPLARADDKPAIDKANEELQAKIKERRAMVEKILDVHDQRVKAGAIIDDRDLALVSRILDAQLALATSPAEREAAQRRRLKYTKDHLDTIRKMVDAGIPGVTLADQSAAEAAALQAEADLLRVRKAPGDEDSPAVRALLKKYHDTLRGAYKQRMERVAAGVNLDPETESQLSTRLLESELALTEKSAERIVAHEEHIKRVKDLVTISEKRLESGIKGIVRSDVLMLKAARAEADTGLLRAKPDAPDKKEKLLGLCKERVKYLEEARDDWKQRVGDYPVSLSRQLLEARIALATTPEERRKAYQDYREVAIETEKVYRTRVEAGIKGFTQATLLEATAHRLEAEIFLLRAEAASKK